MIPFYSRTKSWEEGDKIFGLCACFSFLYINNTAMKKTVVFLIANIVTLQLIFFFWQ